ncbi:MAG: zinc ribbon domain-containing protein [Phycisphaerales bacterium]|nr:zinc ribbon domain-containing protein [Phycisphaerales bacterium]
MPHSPHPILHRRHLAITLLRAIAVGFTLTGLIVLGRHAVPLTERMIGFYEWQYWAAFVMTSVVFILPAIILAAFSRPLARWIVPAPLSGCPTCGFAIAADQKVCPECGTPASSSAKDHPA